MTKLLDQAIAAVRDLPPDTQDELARVLMLLAGEDQPTIPMSTEDEASFAESLAEADRGEFASDAQIRAVWAKHGL